jgi:hypothetical protein
VVRNLVRIFTGSAFAAMMPVGNLNLTLCDRNPSWESATRALKQLFRRENTMKKMIARIVVPTVLAASTLGFGVAVLSAPAGATTAVTAKSYAGTVKAADVTKDRFTLSSGAKTYTVVYTAKTKWAKGTAADLKTGAAVTVTGTITKTVIHASSIKA